MIWPYRNHMRITVIVSGLLIYAALVQNATAQQTVASEARKSDEAARAEELLSRRITLDVTGITRQQAIDLAARNAKVLIQYQAEMLASYAGVVSIHLKDAPLRVVLERALAGTKLQVIADGAKRLAIVDGGVQRADSLPGIGAIEGRVVDSAGRPISRVTVELRGTKRTAITSNAGTFLMRDVPTGDQVIVSRVFGYRPVVSQVKVAREARTLVNITLTSVPNVLSGVVTTATGEQEKRNIGSDITTIDVPAVLKTAPITSLTDLLATRVPGLTAIKTSGAPGDPSRVRLRGTSSVTRSNDPIVFVDGVRIYASQTPRTPLGSSVSPSGQPAVYATPSALDQIDPNTIEKIDVFKGPSASAMYGSDAANGVIVITTKRGRVGKTTWSFTGGTGIEYTPDYNTAITTYWGHSLNNPSMPCTYVGQCQIADSVVTTRYADDPKYNALGTGTRQDASATVNGGTDVLRFSLTGSGQSTRGLLQLPKIELSKFARYHGFNAPSWIEHPDEYVSWATAGNIIMQPSQALQVTLTSTLLNSHQQKTSLNFGAVSRYVDTTTFAGGDCSYCERATSDILTTTNGVGVQWQPLSWLPVVGKLGLNTQSNRNTTLLPRTYRAGTDSIGAYSVATGTTFVPTSDLYTTIQLLNERLSLALGVNYKAEATTDVSSSIRDIPEGVEAPTNIAPNNGMTNASQLTASSSTYGWWIEPQLRISQRFAINPGFRLDGGSASGSRGGFHGSGLEALPKINLSWVASEEPYFPFKNIFSTLRLRTAFGFAGVQPGLTDKQRVLASSTTSFDGDQTTTQIVGITSLGNTRLRPERTRELEGGFEADLLDGRATISFSQYQKLRTDALLSVPVAPSAFSGSVMKNVGEIRNTGTEITGSLTLLQRASVGWTVGGSYSHNENLVVRLNQGQDPISNGDGTRVVAGYALYGRWTTQLVGYSDVNHDGRIDPSEVVVGDTLVYAGPQEPTTSATMNSSLSLFGGRVRMSGALSYSGGLTQTRVLTSDTYAFADSSVPMSVQAFVASRAGLVQEVSSLRFDSFSLNYTMPKRVAHWFRSNDMTVALQGSNLGLSTNFRGRDPNVNAYASGNAVIAAQGLPAPRVWKLQVFLGN